MKRSALAIGITVSLVLSGLSSPASGVAGFGDVASDRFFAEPIQWMVDHEITNGVSPSCFAPDDPVTRGQAAAFIWRMEERPAPTQQHPFQDVVSTWQQDAVSWLFSAGITKGTSSTTYSPDRHLTRGELAALLHRLEGSPVAPAPAAFGDVIRPWQAAPVGWMLQHGITKGTSPTTFSPDVEVTRGELATFFFRYQGTPPVDLDPDSQGCETYRSLAGFHTVGDVGRLGGAARSAWASAVPGIQDVRLQSTLDGEQQPAYWLPPSGEGEQPLLVVLHSWSDDYTQRAGIPYAMWAQENGWAVIAPNFRGPNDNPMAAGSEFAVQDAADAIDFAVAHAGVDADRVYVVGYSGGGMMGLLLAGRHSDRVSAVAAWGPPHDLVDFYAYARALRRSYANQIAAACGGDPSIAGPAREECVRRSPLTYLDAARANHVPILIAQGIEDPFVHPSGAADVFNALADPADRFRPDQLEAFGNSTIPADLPEWRATTTHFGPREPAPVYARRSGAALLVYFEGGHDMAYNATARWFASEPG